MLPQQPIRTIFPIQANAEMAALLATTAFLAVRITFSSLASPTASLEKSPA
jgi:hypothetical protein